MSEPSDRAVEAAFNAQSLGEPETTLRNVRRILRAAHNPALGEDVSVQLGDVLRVLRQDTVMLRDRYGVEYHPVDYLLLLLREGRL